MLFITAETHCLSQVILIYTAFQDTEDPAGDLDPEMYLKGQREGSRLQMLTCFPQFVSGTGQGLQKAEKTCLNIVWID